METPTESSDAQVLGQPGALEQQWLKLERDKWEYQKQQGRRTWEAIGSPAVLVALLGGLAAAFTGVMQLRANRDLERTKFESELILRALAPSDSTERVQRLQFLVRVGLVDDPGGRIVALSNPPQFGATNSVAAPEPSGVAVLGADSSVGCADGLWKHVYRPTRLLIRGDCVTVTGVIVDATAGKRGGGVRHEADGDAQGWLRVDAQFAYLINPGNTFAQGGNLVFEVVCHYAVTEPDAKAACSEFQDHTVIPALGSHVAITGTLVQEGNHSRWNEIHPVTSIEVQP